MNLTLAICIYNASRFLRETLESVMGQTMQNFHLLFVNDCSTDDSVKIINEFFERNPRQHEIVSLEENRGVGYCRHLAERHATTKYMMFLDADDVLRPYAIERMYERITADDDLMAVGCYLEYVNEKGRKIGGGLFLGETTKEGFYAKAEKAKLIFMQPTAIYDRELALSVGGYVIDGFPEEKPRYQDFCEDLDLWTRMSDLYVNKKAIIVIPEVLCSYRKIGGSLSANSFNMILKMRYVKNNLRRRRGGLNDLTFIDFYNGLAPEFVESIKKDAKAADCLRNGVFYLKRGNILKGVYSVGVSIWNRPGYIIDKINNNLLRRK